MTREGSSTPQKVFISYTCESREHSRRVLDIANNLRASGFDADIDQYHSNQNWPAWMEMSIAEANNVLVVCTETYLRRWNNEEKRDVGLGAQWESLLTRQWLYETPTAQNKFIPVVFDRDDLQFIPTPLRNVSRVVLSSGFGGLTRRLLNLAPAEMPPIRTALTPVQLAPDFFSPSSAEHTPHAGLHDVEEPLISNLFPVSAPAKINTATVVRKNKSGKFPDQVKYSWETKAKNTPFPIGYWVEEGTLYTFEDLDGPIWSDLFQRGVLRNRGQIDTAAWADSPSLAVRNNYVKLLNKSLGQLCSETEAPWRLGYSAAMKCYLFQAKTGVKIAHLKVPAIKVDASRMIYKAIKNKLSDDPESIQHWQHEAFRHKFQRFGKTWYLVLTPFWAFTADGMASPSKWQKTSSANMRKPEKNRAVLGHVMFWASILCREPDLFRSVPKLCIHRPAQLKVKPSIKDADWMKVAKDAERSELEADLSTPLLFNET